MACIYLGDEDGIDKRVVFEILQHFHPLVLVSLSINERPEKNIYTVSYMYMQMLSPGTLF